MLSKTSKPYLLDFVKGEVILFDKPLLYSSFDVIRKIKKIIRIRKIGHAGTLDPLATGLMILCTGKKTKEIDQFQNLPKTYSGTMKLGATTRSFDLETTVDHVFDISNLTHDTIINATKHFKGEIMQFPPVFSAIKIDGKRVYQSARKGENKDIPSRKVIIYDFQITAINLPFVDFIICCSKGTYIRSLIHDFGKSLDNGAFVSDLRRLKIGDYHVDDAINFAEFSEIVNSAEKIVLE